MRPELPLFEPVNALPLYLDTLVGISEPLNNGVIDVKFQHFWYLMINLQFFLTINIILTVSHKL